MRNGHYRDRIKIQSDTSNPNDPSAEYSDLYVNEPARITEVSGGETFRGRQVEARTRAVVDMRYRSDVDEQCKIIGQTDPYKDATYNIVAIKIIRKGSRPTGMELEVAQ